MIVALALISLALVVALDCVATVRLAGSDLYTQSQKTAQILIVWLIPIVGSIVVLSVLKATAPVMTGRPTSGSITSSWVSAWASFPAGTK